MSIALIFLSEWCTVLRLSPSLVAVVVRFVPQPVAGIPQCLHHHINHWLALPQKTHPVLCLRQQIHSPLNQICKIRWYNEDKVWNGHCLICFLVDIQKCIINGGDMTSKFKKTVPTWTIVQIYPSLGYTLNLTFFDIYMIITTCEERDTAHSESRLDMMQVCLVECGACSTGPHIHSSHTAEH